MDVMDVEIRHDTARRRFVASRDGEDAELQYERVTERTLDFVRTFVPLTWRGRGIGERLVRRGLDYAQDHGYQVIATCPFVTYVIERHPQYASLIER